MATSREPASTLPVMFSPFCLSSKNVSRKFPSPVGTRKTQNPVKSVCGHARVPSARRARSNANLGSRGLYDVETPYSSVTETSVSFIWSSSIGELLCKRFHLLYDILRRAKVTPGAASPGGNRPGGKQYHYCKRLHKSAKNATLSRQIVEFCGTL